MEAILGFINQYLTIILLVLGLLAWVADYFKWEWLDKFVEFIKALLNFLLPGKQLYSLEDIEKNLDPEEDKKAIAKLKAKEQEYRKDAVLTRIVKTPVKIIKKSVS